MIALRIARYRFTSTTLSIFGMKFMEKIILSLKNAFTPNP